MRTEATREEWARLYRLAAEYKKRKPWKNFCHNNIFSVEPEDGEVAYFSIKGREQRGGGFSLYFGEEGFNCFLGGVDRELLNIAEDYMVAQQNCISMFLSGREEVPFEQYEVISELGLKFRGDGSWIYFETYEKGFFPYIPNQGEVRLCTWYLEKWLEAMDYYREEKVRAFSDEREIFTYFCRDGKWQGEFREPPYKAYQCERFVLEDEIKARYMLRQRKVQDVLEADCFCLAENAFDEEYDKPIWPRVMILVDQSSGMVVKQHLFEVKEKETAGAKLLMEYITEYGRPREVVVPNTLVGAIVEDVCQKCSIKLTYGKVDGCEEAEHSMREELRGFPGYMNEEPGNVLHFLSEAGVDVEKMIENAGHMSEEEFFSSMLDEIERAISEVGFDDLPEYGLTQTDDLIRPYRSCSLTTKKQKEEAVRGFFQLDDVVERDFGEDNRWIEVMFSSRQWRSTLKETRKGKLLEIAANAGAEIEPGISKDRLVGAIISRAELDRQNIKNCLSKKENKLMRELCSLAGDYNNEIELNDFAYSADHVVHLLDAGLVDIRYLIGNGDSILQILPVEEAAHFWKKK